MKAITIWTASALMGYTDLGLQLIGNYEIIQVQRTTKLYSPWSQCYWYRWNKRHKTHWLYCFQLYMNVYSDILLSLDRYCHRWLLSKSWYILVRRRILAHLRITTKNHNISSAVNMKMGGFPCWTVTKKNQSEYIVCDGNASVMPIARAVCDELGIYKVRDVFLLK